MIDDVAVGLRRYIEYYTKTARIGVGTSFANGNSADAAYLRRST